MAYLIFKALHIIGFVSWFAGLFYIVRLFIYHKEVEDKSNEERRVLHDQFKIMEKRLFYIITQPAMIFTIVCGLAMIYLNPYIWNTWLQIKLGLVGVLVFYHHYCLKIMKQLWNETCKWSSDQLRLFNEGATVLLIAIVLLAVLKNASNFLVVFTSTVAVILVLFIATKAYKRSRQKSVNDQA